ncbi:hypothetical protein OJ997_33925 [Solirubrobacter phytolaccae]|uniref:Uncharacterized protein n=1 Tax=Solirubrobacter phytolaccae TaxID=1404360 RepID=A0A9X3NFP4_9ACTN|nr:hypothetical protein [Solirubrobacter phytolaccae]MDA0185354.1 hypothetical protein [Solirubrobacter phytolaccae]
MNLRLTAILTGAFLMTAAIAVGVFWVLGHGDRTARTASSEFAAALVRADPALAPKGAAGYVKGVRQEFGAVRAARVIDSRSHRIHGRNGRTYYLTQVLLETEKGPAVVELEFDAGQLTFSNDEVSGVRELLPRDVRHDALADDELVALAKAFQRRGDGPASDLELSGTMVRTPDIVKALPQRIRALTSSSQRHLRCVQRARADVEKIAACSR